MDIVYILRGLFGIILIVCISFLFSNNKKNINWGLVIKGLALQFFFAILILKGEDLRSIFAPFGWPKDFFGYISKFFVLILNFTSQGAIFVFGDLAKPPGADGSLGSFFAFQVLPTIIFFASFMSVLYYIGFMEWVVKITYHLYPL